MNPEGGAGRGEGSSTDRDASAPGDQDRSPEASGGRTGPFHLLADEGPRGGPIAYRLRTLRLELRRRAGTRLGLLSHHRPRAMRIPASYRQAVAPDPPLAISVVVPSLDQAPYLGRTLDSLLDQAYPALEVIVEDGGSTDGTGELLRRYEGRLAHVTTEPDGGQANAINNGFARSTGEIMHWLNSDDLLLPGALAYVASYFATHPEVDVVYGHRILIDERDREIGRWALPAHDGEILSWADYIPQETVFWRRDIWERAGGRIDESFRYAIDWDLLLRFREAGARFMRLPRYLGAFRVHASQKSSAAVAAVGRPEMERLRRRVHGRDVSGDEVRRAIRPYLRRHRRLDRLQRLHLVRD